MRFIVTLLFLIITGALLFAGCTAFEGSNSESLYKGAVDEAEWSQSEEYAPAPMAMNVMTSESPGGSSRAISEESIESEQKIIKTADIRIEVLNVSNAAEIIQNITVQYNGMIQSSSIYVGSKNRYSGTVIIRIPADSFDDALIDLKTIGKILSSSVKAEDVTEEYVDLVAQKNALTNQLAQYNRLLEKGQNVSEILEVQKEIERVQVQLDRIVGRMKYLDNRTSFSTITISLTEPSQVETPSGYSLPEVISEGIKGFFDTVVWLFIAVLTLLPLILIGGAGFFIYRRWKRNRSE